MFDQLVRSIVRPPSMNGAMRLISSAERTDRPGPFERRCPPGRRTSWPVSCQARQARALQRQRAVVLRETLGQPQLARHVRAIEVERLERAGGCARRSSSGRTRAPRCRAGPTRSLRMRAGRGHHRAVAVLHAVAVGVRQVVGEKRVVARLVRRELAVDRALFAHDPLDVLHEAIELGVGAGVMRRRTRNVRPPTENWRSDTGPNSTGLSIRYCRFGAVNSKRRRARMQLRRHGPGRPVTPGGCSNVSVAGDRRARAPT